MLLLADLSGDRLKVCSAIARLKQNPATRHVPVIAFGNEDSPEIQKGALEAGVTLIVSESAILNHLSECLDQALSLE
jgi:CheY-like chemotaxis protein